MAIETDHLNVVEIWNNTTIDEGALEIIKHIAEFKEQQEEKADNLEIAAEQGEETES